jgi:hypothetical protein
VRARFVEELVEAGVWDGLAGRGFWRSGHGASLLALQFEKKGEQLEGWPRLCG